MSSFWYFPIFSFDRSISSFSWSIGATQLIDDSIKPDDDAKQYYLLSLWIVSFSNLFGFDTYHFIAADHLFSFPSATDFYFGIVSFLVNGFNHWKVVFYQF
tara:strand:- start:142 stop:444 length:303 start_codon:yes stop_codon:yes gene_type:complete